MRTIKFRGKTRRGEIIYSNGYLNGMLYKFGWHSVVECEQFIGVDKNGAEIYEGDKVIREYFGAEKTFFIGVDEAEEPFQATFEDFAAIRDGEIIKCGR